MTTQIQRMNWYQPARGTSRKSGPYSMSENHFKSSQTLTITLKCSLGPPVSMGPPVRPLESSRLSPPGGASGLPSADVIHRAVALCRHLNHTVKLPSCPQQDLIKAEFLRKAGSTKESVVGSMAHTSAQGLLRQARKDRYANLQRFNWHSMNQLQDWQIQTS